jgi:hypothetical protein
LGIQPESDSTLSSENLPVSRASARWGRSS